MGAKALTFPLVSAELSQVLTLMDSSPNHDGPTDLFFIACTHGQDKLGYEIHKPTDHSIS